MHPVTGGGRYTKHLRSGLRKAPAVQRLHDAVELKHYLSGACHQDVFCYRQSQLVGENGIVQWH